MYDNCSFFKSRLREIGVFIDNAVLTVEVFRHRGYKDSVRILDASKERMKVGTRRFYHVT